MCIIVYKPKGIAMPSKETLKRCFNINNDGAGYMFIKDNKVHIDKGYSNFEAFYNSLMKDVDKYNSPFVMHFRIGTHGDKSAGNTHPFPVSKNIVDLTALSCDTDVGVAHNGILTLPSKEKSDVYSDTMLFDTNYLALMIKSPRYYEDKDIITMIDGIIDGDRLAILSNDGHVELLGDFKEDNGCYYSNGSYKPYEPKKYVYEDSYMDYAHYFDKYADDDTLFGKYIESHYKRRY